MPSKSNSILIGGLVAGLIGTVIAVVSTQMTMGALESGDQPNQMVQLVFGLIGCLVPVSAGLIAVWHYTGENELTLRGGQGVGLGALTGIAYAVVAVALGFLLQWLNVLPSPDEYMDTFVNSGALDQAGEEAADAILRWTEFMVRWGSIIMALVFGVVMGLIGGAIGAAMFKRGEDDSIPVSS